MNKQEIATTPMALVNKIKRWDYDESVKKMRPFYKQWKRATIEMLRELYLAKEFLTGQKGQHRDPDAPNFLQYSWSKYCDEIGLSYQTANNWLRQFEFVPREISDTGKDALMLLEAPVKEDTTALRALKEARINEVLLTGQRPTDWDNDKEEKEYQRRLENAKYLRLAEDIKLNAPVVERTKTDYFAESLKKSKDIANFKLESREQIIAQYTIFEHIEAYLKTFKDTEIKACAAFNLALKTRNLANEIAELNFQLKETEYDS